MIIPISELDNYIEKLKKDRQSIVLVGGCFDILHRGHIEFLQKAASYGTVLVFLESDTNVTRRKGTGRPIHTQHDRARLLCGIEGVGGVIMLDEMREDHEYFELVKRIQPDIIGITEGEAYTTHLQKHADAVGAQLVMVTPRIQGYSMRGIIEKVKTL